MNEEINKIINWIEMSYTRLNYKEELLLVNYIKYLQQENARLKENKKEHEIMKKILIENGLWETLLNDDRFLEYLREEN